MNKLMKRTIPLVLSAAMALSYAPAAYAEEETEFSTIGTGGVSNEETAANVEEGTESVQENETGIQSDTTINGEENPEGASAVSDPDTEGQPSVLPAEENNLLRSGTDTVPPTETKEKKDGDSTKEDLYAGWDTIKVFETTDVHGWITDVSTYDEATFQYRLAYIANVVNKARENEAYDDVLLLDTGDIYQGTPHSNLTYGAALVAAFDEMKYDAVGLGNHEFDWDVKKYATDSDGTMPAYEIGEFTGDPDIPVLMNNLYYKETGERVEFTQDYTILEKTENNYKIAVVGWACDYSADIKASQIAPYTIDDDLDHLKEKVAKVQEEEEPDVLIILTHSAPEYVAEAMDPDQVDLVLGGHTHVKSYGTAENGIPYTQGYRYAYGYATAEIKIEPETREVAVINPGYESTPYDASELYDNEANKDKLDQEIVAISKAAWDAVKDDMYEVLCTIDKDLSKNPINENTSTSTAGTWLAGLMMEATADLDTVAAFTNSGGIRTSLELADGAKARDITVADIYTITPFGNRLLSYSITGKQMKQQLENALQGSYENSNYGDQFAGIVVNYKTVEGGIEVVSITMDDGEKIDINDDTKTYNVVVNEYCATLAGSVFEHLTPLVEMDQAPVDNESAIAVLRARKAEVGTAFEVDDTVRAVDVTGQEEEPGTTEEPGDDTKDPGTTEEPGDDTKDPGTAQEPGSDTKNDGKKPTGKTPVKTDAAAKNTASPKTGDTADPALWIMLLAVCGTCGAGAIAARKKQSRG